MRIASLLPLLLSGCLGPGLTVAVTQGEGTITSDPAGIDCSDSCGMIASGPVTLTATPAEGAVFAGWSGACTGTGSCVVSGEEDMHVEAAFDSMFYPLVVTRTGEGSVTAPGIDCGDDCEQIVRHGTEIIAVAKPAPGWSLISLDGPGCATSQCRFTMREPNAIAVGFEHNNDLVVDIDAETDADGSVVSTPAGISCGHYSQTGCTSSFSPKATVTLTAVASGGSIFQGWTGACTTTLGYCTVTMDQARQVTAHFASSQPHLTVLINGNGTVSSPTSPIMCPGKCTTTVPVGTTVALTATATPGSTFAGWSGVNCSSSTCMFPVNGTMTVTAEFTTP